ncbi:MAG: PD40 domain-containing protein, partial [Candidatus Marinimicrobia bacterium]|nr:PD40 domain-containing protein [Candidatus Neomarinimicrobiota bacterium]
LGEGQYIWLSISPDKSKLLFTLAGRGTFITDLNGNALIELGYANAPMWSPDGNWVVYMVDEDDGYRITASDIYAVSSDGKEKVQLTNTQNTIEMHPNWSPSMDKIVFDTIEGNIMLIEVKIAE